MPRRDRITNNFFRETQPLLAILLTLMYMLRSYLQIDLNYLRWLKYKLKIWIEKKNKNYHNDMNNYALHLVGFDETKQQHAIKKMESGWMWGKIKIKFLRELDDNHTTEEYFSGYGRQFLIFNNKTDSIQIDACVDAILVLEHNAFARKVIEYLKSSKIFNLVVIVL